MIDKKYPKDIWFNKKDKRFKWTPARLNKLAQNLNEWIDKGIEDQKSFLLGDWCFANDFYPNYFSIYRERSKALDEAYTRAKAWQSHCIAKGALFNNLNVKMATLWLLNHHTNEGWKVFQNTPPPDDGVKSQIEEINTNMKKAYERLDKGK